MSHKHSHTERTTFGTAFALATGLNVLIVALQVWYGFVSHSTALLADATHNAGDVIGLVLAWGAYILAKRQPSERFTYGLRSSTILAALLNGMFLLVATGGIVWEALQRIINPAPVDAGVILVIASIAILLNGLSAFLLSRGKSDINIRSAFWHLVSDAAVSAGVVVVGFLIVWTGYALFDPLASILIGFVIVWSTWGLFREALRLSLQAVPSEIDIEAVRSYLGGTRGVVRVHDLHIWPISSTETALTCHFVVNDSFDSSMLSKISDELEHRFKIDHATIQLETPDGKPCRLAPETAV